MKTDRLKNIISLFFCINNKIGLCKKCGGKIEKSGICSGCGNVYMSQKSKQAMIYMGIVCFIFFVVGWLFLTESTTEKYDRLSESIVLLNIYDEEDAVIGRAGGFFINDDRTILTNYHVVDIAYRLEAVTKNGNTYDVSKILCYDDNSDLAILSCDLSTGISPLKITDSDSVNVGDNVFVIDLENAVQGEITDIFEENNRIFFEMVCPSSDICSGSAVFNKKGGIIGITKNSTVDDLCKNNIISSNEISKLIYTEYMPILIKDFYNQKYGDQYVNTFDSTDVPDDSADFEYKIIDGLATITGYVGDEKQLIIPNSIDGNSVTAIGDEVFRNKAISTVTISDGIEVIGKQAFVNCKSLSQVTLPDTIKIIDDAAFAACDSLPSINFPKSLTAIGQLAFAGCDSLESIEIPEHLDSIGDLAFSSCGLKNTVIIPSGVKNLGHSVFANCQALKNICVEDENKFYRDIDGILFSADGSILMSFPCGKKIENYCLPESVIKIGADAFWGCQSLKSIQFNSQLCCIEDSAFYGCSSLSSVNIPDSVTTIEEQAFRDCTDLSVVTMSKSVSVIGTSTFNNCSSLKTINVTEQLLSIGYAAFSGCGSLDSIYLSSNINTIGGYAFENCSDLTIYCVDGSIAQKYAHDNDIRYVLFDFK